MKNEKPTWNHENHENRPGTMKKRPRTMKNHENQPGTMKNIKKTYNLLGTIKKIHEKPTWSNENHKNAPGTIKHHENLP